VHQCWFASCLLFCHLSFSFNVFFISRLFDHISALPSIIFGVLSVLIYVLHLCTMYHCIILVFNNVRCLYSALYIRLNALYNYFFIRTAVFKAHYAAMRFTIMSG